MQVITQQDFQKCPRSLPTSPHSIF